jgi:glycosyltransferase involved in cell wall biosynthesis
MAKLFGLYSEVLWQASTEHEKLDIQTKMNINESNIWLAKDLPEHISLSNIQNTPEQASSSILNILFLSRISPMKNLDFALKVLSKVKRDVRFDIYGPKEDLQYWLKCEALMDKLPMNVQAHYLGVVEPDRVAPTFANYDLFLFPTRGENYGHVIAESLAVGTPVLLSDQTPWKRLGEDGLGWDISLDSQGDFVDVIESFPLLGLDGRQNYREDVRESAMKRIHNSQDITDNKELFHSAIRLLG